MKIKWSSAPTPSAELIDAVMDAYITWREDSAAVDASYRTWRHAPGHERALSYDNYVAALDREELAANEYMRLVEQAEASAMSSIV
jgi:hypothetical protein